MSDPTLDRRIEEMTASITALASEVKSKTDMPKDRVAYIEAEIVRLDGELETVLAEKRQKLVEDRINGLEARLRESAPSSKAAAILAGAVGVESAAKAFGKYNNETNWLRSIVDAKRGDPEAQQFVKAVLGTSDATGQAIVPNNFVAGLVEIASANNIYRQLMNVVTGVQGAGVDVPYEVDDTYAANLSSFGSNKTIVDFGFNQVTATLYTIAQIADVGNQLLRQSNGAAEAVARRRLGKSIAKRESQLISNGSGSSQPRGFLQAFLDFGDVAANKYALNSETRAAALGNGIAKLEARSQMVDSLAIVMHPTDFWEMSVETNGTSGSGGWAMDPVGGATTPRVRVWGVPVYRDPFLPAAGTAIVGNFGECDIYFGQEYRIDVSSEANTRWDKNITGFRAEEEIGFDALPYIATGGFLKVTGV